MLVYLPPGFEAAAHTGDVFEAILEKKRRRPETTVTVVAVNHDWRFFVGVAKKFLHVAIVEVNRAVNMRVAIGTGIANIDEHTFVAIELLLSVMNLNLRNLHLRPLLAYSRSSIKPKPACPQRQISRPIMGDGYPSCYNLAP